MTNGEKFKEVFGFYPDRTVCLVPDEVCEEMQNDTKVICPNCPFYGFMDREYKPCFRMKIYDDGK